MSGDGGVVKLVVRLRRGVDGLGIATKGGVIINCVAGGQADADGLLEPGDEVLTVDGMPLDGQPLGKVMQRGAESYDLVLTRRQIALASSVLRLLPGSEVAEAAAAGAPLRLLRLRLARGAHGLGLDVSGLNVLKRVVPGSAAEATGEWREGDVIVSVNGLELGAAKLVQALPKDTSTYDFGVLRAEARAALTRPAAPRPAAPARPPVEPSTPVTPPAAPAPPAAPTSGGGGLFGGLFGGWGGTALQVGNESYRLGRQIGEGGYSVVFEATNASTRVKVAVQRNP
jgi:hypothetical protein